MDQVKIGSFIKSLCKAKGLTQEQAAERFFILCVAAAVNYFRKITKI